MESIGYKRSLVDPAVLVRHTPTGTCMIHSHVDDCADTGPSVEIYSDYQKLLQRFDGRVLGECDGQVFLGMLHERDWETGVIYLSQPRHIDSLLFDHGFDAERPVRSPLDHKAVLIPTREHDEKVHPKLASYPA